jgi:hypothetical protein
MAHRRAREAESKGESKKYSAREIIDNFRLSQGAVSHRKGVFEAEAILLLCKKIGISEREIKELVVRSIRRNVETAKAFTAARESSPLDKKAILTELAATLPPPGFIPRTQGTDLKVGQLSLLPINGSEGVAHANAVGRGSGPLLISTGESQPGLGRMFLFQFRTVETGVYIFAAPLFVVGDYFLVADDGPCETKYAQVTISYSIHGEMNVQDGIASPVVVAGGGPYPIVSKRVENEAFQSYVAFSQRLEFYLHLTGNKNHTFVIGATVSCTARGEGSSADADLTIVCPELQIGWVQYGGAGG